MVFCFQLCGAQLIFLVNDVFKPVFGDSLIRFGVLDVFQDVNNEFLHVFIQIYYIDLEHELF